MAAESVKLIRSAGGVALSAPSMQEVPLDAAKGSAPGTAGNAEAFVFAEELLAGRIDIAIFLTGVGTRYLFDTLASRYTRAELVQALAATTVVARSAKPLRVLRELEVPVAIVAPEPNTWREVLVALDDAAPEVRVSGAHVAVQEYGVSNTELLSELRARGAKVRPVPVYRWMLPDDLAPLHDAIRQVIARTVDVLLFTSSNQVFHLLEVVRSLGCEDAFRSACREVVIGSVGPLCSQTLAAEGFAVDFEPAHSKLGALIKEGSERAPELVIARRQALRRSTATALASAAVAAAAADAGDSVFMRACRRQPVPYTPVWLMRQAGRYMQEYRELRARVSFIELCKTPDLAAQAAVDAQRRLGVDAAILFSDILLLLEPVGLGLEYVHGEGPSLTRLVRAAADVDRLCEVDPHASLAYVFEAVRRTRAELDARVPLIGFSGAPFTLASYMIEGGGSKNYIDTKRFMYADKGAWDAMMALLSRAVVAYLKGQIDAGTVAVQLFDSWVGCLSPHDYRTYVLPHMRAIVSALPPQVPIIHFGTETATLLELQVSAGAGVIGIDHRVEIASAFERFPGVAVQGNLDPVLLFAEHGALREQTARVLAEVGGRPGHIFNLGHGILPGTPVDNVIALVDMVHEMSAR
ncbi:MAG: uroporphyrinogen decarboxylase [Deltaproteobacteria bacterium]|nr:uroporphyrinogen decarboxylase [Deltaproteobacteria bacterium]